MIYAGKVNDISWAKGIWLILDIGFSNNKKTCGIVLGDNKADKLKFNDAIDEVVRIATEKPLLNLVIEAPLSVAFDRLGNPKARSIEKKGVENRLWYVGPGCAVLVAAMYLMRKLYDSRPAADIKLFEGFVSYKSKAARSSHLGDVELLRKAIKSRRTLKHHVIKPGDLKIDRDDNIRSAFEVMNMKDIDPGIPPVIKVDG
ncbi:MAG: hypothetical protein OEW48_17680 [Phycisphaerae bacterium]|nr:hypothetical protein [Phycisphaerae bacterium]